MATLTTILGDGNAGTGTRDWTTQAATDVDEGISAADGNYATSQPAKDITQETSFALTNVDSDLGNVDTLSWAVRFGIAGITDDTYHLDCAIYSGATLLAAATSGGTWTRIATLTTDQAVGNSGPTAFAYVNTTATKAQWDAAEIKFRCINVGNKAGDNATLSLDTYEFTGTYTPGAAGVNVNATAATLTASAQTVTPTPAAYSVNATAATLTASAQTVTPGGPPTPDLEVHYDTSYSDGDDIGVTGGDGDAFTGGETNGTTTVKASTDVDIDYGDWTDRTNTMEVVTDGSGSTADRYWAFSDTTYIGWVFPWVVGLPTNHQTIMRGRRITAYNFGIRVYANGSIQLWDSADSLIDATAASLVADNDVIWLAGFCKAANSPDGEIELKIYDDAGTLLDTLYGNDADTQGTSGPYHDKLHFGSNPVSNAPNVTHHFGQIRVYFGATASPAIPTFATGVNVNATAATMTAAAQTTTPTLTALNTNATAAALTTAAQTTTPTPAALSINATAGTMSTAAQTVAPTLAAKTVNVTAATATVAAQAATPTAAIAIEATAATMTLAAQVADSEAAGVAQDALLGLMATMM